MNIWGRIRYSPSHVIACININTNKSRIMFFLTNEVPSTYIHYEYMGRIRYSPSHVIACININTNKSRIMFFLTNEVPSTYILLKVLNFAITEFLGKVFPNIMKLNTRGTGVLNFLFEKRNSLPKIN